MDSNRPISPANQSSFIPISGPTVSSQTTSNNTFINKSVFTDFKTNFQKIAPTIDASTISKTHAYNGLLLTKLGAIVSTLQKQIPSIQNTSLNPTDIYIQVNSGQEKLSDIIKNYNQTVQFLNQNNAYNLPVLANDLKLDDFNKSLSNLQKPIQNALSIEQKKLQTSLHTLNLNVSIEKNNFYPPILRVQKNPSDNSITIITRRGTDTVEITYTLNLTDEDNKLEISFQEYEGPQQTIQANLERLKSLPTNAIIGLFIFTSMKNDKDLMETSIKASMAVTDYINACTNLMQSMTASQASLLDDPNATINASGYYSTMQKLGIPVGSDMMWNAAMISGYITSVNNQLQLATQKSAECNQLISITNSETQKDFKILSNMLQSLGSLTGQMYNNI